MWRVVTPPWPLEPPVFKPAPPPRCRWNNTGKLLSLHASRSAALLSQRWVFLSLDQTQQCHLVASVGPFFLFSSVHCVLYAIQWLSLLLVCCCLLALVHLFLSFWNGDHRLNLIWFLWLLFRGTNDDVDENAVANATVLATVDQAPNYEPHDDSAQFISEAVSTAHVKLYKSR